MSNRYKGGVISATPPTTTGGNDGVASGAWTLEQQMQAQAAGLWPNQPVFYIEDVFSTYLYTGTSASQTINNGIDLAGKGGLVWFKPRAPDGYSHFLYDTSRGIYKSIRSNTTGANQTLTSTLTAFNTTGFTLGTDADGTGINSSGISNASWTFRKQPKFFDVVTWTGDSTAGRTVAHNLGSVPACIIVKCTSQAVGGGWPVYHRSLGNTQTAVLNTTDAAFTYGYWNNTTPTSTVFTLNGDSDVNGTGKTYVAYLFAHNAGGFGLTGTDNVISCGSFTADNAGGGAYAGGATVNLGYEPQFVLIKQTNSTLSDPNWIMVDTFRGYRAQETSGSDVGQQRLRANTSEAEANAGGCSWPTATGFSALQLTGGATYIYIAIRRGPMKVPTSGTSVFSPVAYTGNGGTQNLTTGFAGDMAWIDQRTDAGQLPQSFDKLRGNNVVIYQSSTSAEQTNSPTSNTVSFNNTQTVLVGPYSPNGIYNNSGSPQIAWNFRRAPSFFDEVCYTGTGSARTITHNLGVAPELMIMKRRDATANWPVYTASTATNEYLFLNSGGLPTTATTVWNNTAPTSSVFSVGTSALTNASAGTYVAYLFSSCAGVSKVGSYTGTGALQTINCGFTSGARFVLIKLISSGTSGSGDWYVWDSARGISSGNDPYLLLDSTSAEVTGTNYVDTDTTGFKVTAAGATDINASGDIYLFLAIA